VTTSGEQSQVISAVLRQLMRHESIGTTPRYYVGLDTDATTEILYAAIPKGDLLGASAPKRQQGLATDQSQTPVL